MSRNENGKQKLFRLLEILIRYTDEQHGITMSEIISKLSEYGISAERKSLYNDFLVLEDMGLPVSKIKEKQTRYYLDFQIFEFPELKMLVDAVQSSKFITATKSREIISKLERLTSIYNAKALSRQVFVDAMVKTANKASIYTVDEVHNAINSNLKLKFHYFEYDAQKQKKLRKGGEFYLVSPLSLVWSEENYYLVAFEDESGKIKHFRIDKMVDVRSVNEPRTQNEIIDNFDPANYSRRLFSMYGGREELVTIECREKLAGVMIDRFGTEPTFHKTEFGFKFSIRLLISPPFFAWVLGFADDVRILEPSSVKNELVEILNKTCEQYKG